MEKEGKDLLIFVMLPVLCETRFPATPGAAEELGFVCLSLVRCSQGPFCLVSWTQPPEKSLAHFFQRNNVAASYRPPHPLNCPRSAYSPKPFTALTESLENCSTIIHFAVPSFSVLQPHRHAEGTSRSFQTALKRRKVPSSSKHYDYDYCCFYRKMVPTWGSVHIQHLCGASSFHQKAASLILRRKGPRRRSWI